MINKETENVNMGKIQWFDHKISVNQPCSVCGSDGYGLLLADSPYPESPILQLNRCRKCESLYFQEESIKSFENIWLGTSEVNQRFEYLNNFKKYVEVGAGINAMLRYVHCVPVPENSSLLDVGCGFGFVMDYWSRVRKAQAVGLEKTMNGRMGREKLNVEVHELYLADYLAQNNGKKFDLVFSTEVIEHIHDPIGFIVDLKNVLAEKGVIILTTPSAEFINQESHEIDIYQELAPGEHIFILSKKYLTEMLHNVGFKNVQVDTFEKKLIAVASNRSLKPIDLNRFTSKNYFDYLNKLCKVNDKYVKSGALFRLFEGHVNLGNINDANEFFNKLVSFGHEAYGIDLKEPQIEEVLKIKSPNEYLEKFPAWFPQALYYSGMIHCHNGNLHSQLHLFDLATRMLRKSSHFGTDFELRAKSMLTSAEFHFMQAMIFILMQESTYMLGTSVRDGEQIPDLIWRTRFKEELMKLIQTLKTLNIKL